MHLQRPDRRPRCGDFPDADPVVAGNDLLLVQHHDRGAGLCIVVPFRHRHGADCDQSRHEAVAEYGVDAAWRGFVGVGPDRRCQHELCPQCIVAQAGTCGESRCIDPRINPQRVYAARYQAGQPERGTRLHHDAGYRLL
ncbi:hypothetical protein D3C71_1748710 [compost metagenome]